MTAARGGEEAGPRFRIHLNPQMYRPFMEPPPGGTESAAAAGRKTPATPRIALLPGALLLLPAAAAVAFVHAFGRALPLTDEWHYVRALRWLHDVDWSSLAGWREAYRLYPKTWYDHIVALPFVAYAPVAEATHYDSRWAIALTVAAFAGQVFIYRAALVPSAWAVLPIALVVFCPSHYMEFLWGWQATVTFSVVFPLAGLAFLDGIADPATGRVRLARTAAGLALLLFGVFSSSGAVFALASAVLVVGLSRIGWWRKALVLGACAVAAGLAAIVYIRLMRSDPGHVPLAARHVVFRWREAMDVCTALGAALWGSPVGLSEFGLDARSAGGLAIVALTAVVAGRAAVQRSLPKLALPLGVALMGILCMASIAMARPYLGNWHVQYALPAVCGGYAAAYALWRVDRTLWAGVPFFALSALLVSSVVGYYEGFTRYGPDYQRYVRSIEDYQFRNLTEPGLPTPYPPQGPNEMDAQLFLFLEAHGHPLFADASPPRPAGPLPRGARVFRDDAELPRPAMLEGGAGKVSVLTVVVPGPTTAGGVRARIGDENVRLRRVHPEHVPAAARSPNATHFMAVIVPSRLPAGVQRVDLEMLEN